MAVDHVVEEAFNKKIDVDSDFTIVTQNNLADEYNLYGGQTATGETHPAPLYVEQVPVLLSVKGPLSLKRNGAVQRRALTNPTYWYVDAYRVTVGEKGVV